MLLPVLRLTADGDDHSVEEIREQLKKQFKITTREADMTHEKSGRNVFVNNVAWALAHLVMGKLIECTATSGGLYRITARGVVTLKQNPPELAISDLH